MALPIDRVMNGTYPTLTPEAGTQLGNRPPWTSRLAHWVAEARSHRVICLLIGIWIFNGFDLAFTILSHEQGLLREANPLASHMLQQGTLSIVLFKTGLVLVGSYPLLRFRTARIAELAAYLIFVAYAMLAFRWSIYFEFFTANMPSPKDFAELGTP